MTATFTQYGAPQSAVPPITVGEPIPYEEKSRRALAYWLMGILTLVVGFIGYFIATNGADEASPVVSVFLTPIIGLVGTVLGFYFGGNTNGGGGQG